MPRRLLTISSEMPPLEYWGKGLCLLAIVGLTDYATGYELTFPAFYFLPVFVVSWGGTRVSGFGIAGLCACVWFTADNLNRHPYSAEFYRFWNLGIWLVAFSIVSVLVSKMSSLLRKERTAREALRTAYGQLALTQRQVVEESTAKIRALDQLRHADRLKTIGRLAAGVAHEMGTPLNVISGRIHLILSQRLPEDQVQKNATIVSEQVERMSVIIQQLLDFARRRPSSVATHDIHVVIVETLQFLRPLGQKQGVSVIYTEASEPFPVKMDLSQIQQVLTNLIVNAIQAMPGGGDVTVDVQRVQETLPGERQPNPRPWACISVTDRGEGISEEDVAHLFEPFFTTKDIGQGTGLGLSIAYGIVAEHGGWIDVKSERGNGSRFSFYLPLEE